MDLIKERIKQNEDLYRLKKFERSHLGKIEAEAPTSGSKPALDKEHPVAITVQAASGGRHGQPNPRPQVRAGGNLYSLFIKKNGLPCDEKREQIEIDVRWVGQDSLPSPDRAASYVPETRTLLIDRDFRVFTNMIEWWLGKYRSLPGCGTTVSDTIRGAYTFVLYETILRAEYIRGEIEWTEDSFQKLVSDEALTAAVLPVYHIEKTVRQSLAVKLGSLKDTA